MACVKPNGELTELGRRVLDGLAVHATPEAAAAAVGLPVYRARMAARALEAAGLARGEAGRYALTPEGERRLAM
ncbi:hypothetical protein NNJEOMEG_03934 [Fundidesulfovibrio magnetotacticus]|uniref:Transcriptional regulator n=1 Tax=Fundidesulfovibrio magnetotacticus TaxID=2730080 RepID=A0A6V8LZ40_9BACT|nr:hypothetical protein [Fundidesulfovibrio magnetotacticus]GFK96060.1 hypothetical protein NNJEOMEG_03934 [Fundidesulfovibrio magnetotacticus]